MKTKKPKIHQLTNMEIHEVSLVDHAANKRRFLIAKRSDPVSHSDRPEDQEATAAQPPSSETPPAEQAPPAPAGDETQSLLKEVVQALREMATAQAESAAKPQAVAEPSVDAIAKGFQQRINRLEKHFGMPNSALPDASTPPRHRHTWPFDINRPVSVDAVAPQDEE
jgi:hypothetical protein